MTSLAWFELWYLIYCIYQIHDGVVLQYSNQAVFTSLESYWVWCTFQQGSPPSLIMKRDHSVWWWSGQISRQTTSSWTTSERYPSLHSHQQSSHGKLQPELHQTYTIRDFNVGPQSVPQLGPSLPSNHQSHLYHSQDPDALKNGFWKHQSLRNQKGLAHVFHFQPMPKSLSTRSLFKSKLLYYKTVL